MITTYENYFCSFDFSSEIIYYTPEITTPTRYTKWRYAEQIRYARSEGLGIFPSLPASGGIDYGFIYVHRCPCCKAPTYELVADRDSKVWKEKVKLARMRLEDERRHYNEIFKQHFSYYHRLISQPLGSENKGN